MSTIIDKLSDYYRNVGGFESTDSEMSSPILHSDFSSQILQIFNMTEADLAKIGENGSGLVETGGMLGDSEGTTVINNGNTTEKTSLDKD